MQSTHQHFNRNTTTAQQQHNNDTWLAALFSPFSHTPLQHRLVRALPKRQIRGRQRPRSRSKKRSDQPPDVGVVGLVLKEAEPPQHGVALAGAETGEVVGQALLYVCVCVWVFKDGVRESTGAAGKAGKCMRS